MSQFKQYLRESIQQALGEDTTGMSGVDFAGFYTPPMTRFGRSVGGYSTTQNAGYGHGITVQPGDEGTWQEDGMWVTIHPENDRKLYWWEGYGPNQKTKKWRYGRRPKTETGI